MAKIIIILLFLSSNLCAAPKQIPGGLRLSTAEDFLLALETENKVFKATGQLILSHVLIGISTEGELALTSKLKHASELSQCIGRKIAGLDGPVLSNLAIETLRSTLAEFPEMGKSGVATVLYVGIGRKYCPQQLQESFR